MSRVDTEGADNHLILWFIWYWWCYPISTWIILWCWLSKVWLSLLAEGHVIVLLITLLIYALRLRWLIIGDSWLLLIDHGCYWNRWTPPSSITISHSTTTKTPIDQTHYKTEHYQTNNNTSYGTSSTHSAGVTVTWINSIWVTTTFPARKTVTTRTVGGVGGAPRLRPASTATCCTLCVISHHQG